jgi:carboxyl-terminal processing protease
VTAAHAQSAASDDARALIDLIFENYAYPERLAGFSEQRLRTLRDQDAARVTDGSALLTFGERALAALFDHHAILGSSFDDSYGLVPSYCDLWIEASEEGALVITDVRVDSPAEAAGVRSGDVLIGVEGRRLDSAIARFIEAPASDLTIEQRAYCARVLATGRRDRKRLLQVTRNGVRRRVEIENLYANRVQRGSGPVTMGEPSPGIGLLRFNDSLGDQETVSAFDAAMQQAGGYRALIIDLRDTPGGGNTYVARAIMGRFVHAPTPYQRHELPNESRNGGPRRSWIEEVSPRGEKFGGPVVVLVGRWTGSMGEGMALGFDAIGANIVGTRMAGLLGAVYDFNLPSSGLLVKLPTERLAHVNNTPREVFTPPTLLPHADWRGAEGDTALATALRIFSR